MIIINIQFNDNLQCKLSKYKDNHVQNNNYISNAMLNL